MRPYQKNKSLAQTFNLLIVSLIALYMYMDLYMFLDMALNDLTSIGIVLLGIIAYFCFFIQLSNLALGISCIILLIKPECQHPAFKALRLGALLCISITGIVFNLVLRPENLPFNPANEIMHVITPIMGVLGWLIFGPPINANKKTIYWVTLPPVIYLLGVLIFGSLTGLFPYPFLDPKSAGSWLIVVVNVTAVIIMFFLLAFLISWVDKKKLPIKY